MAQNYKTEHIKIKSVSEIHGLIKMLFSELFYGSLLLIYLKHGIYPHKDKKANSGWKAELIENLKTEFAMKITNPEVKIL